MKLEVGRCGADVQLQEALDFGFHHGPAAAMEPATCRLTLTMLNWQDKVAQMRSRILSLKAWRRSTLFVPSYG